MCHMCHHTKYNLDKIEDRTCICIQLALSQPNNIFTHMKMFPNSTLFHTRQDFDFFSFQLVSQIVKMFLNRPLDNQNKLIEGVSMSYALNMTLDKLFKMSILKRVYLSFSNVNTTLKKIIVLCCPALQYMLYLPTLLTNSQQLLYLVLFIATASSYI